MGLGVQTKKECQIELAHLKTHKDTARRLRAVVQREGALQGELHTKQQLISVEMQECDSLCITFHAMGKLFTFLLCRPRKL